MNRTKEKPEVPESLQNAMLALLDERARQMFEKGFDAEHDDTHTGGQLAAAAASHACLEAGEPGIASRVWPFTFDEFNSANSARKDLIKAGSLILAELERLERAEKAGMTAEVQS